MNKENGSCNVGYWLGSPFWNNGICSKAITLVIEFGFNHLGVNAIWAEWLKENVPSVKVLVKNGFNKEREFTFEDGKFEGEKGVWYLLKKQ